VTLELLFDWPRDCIPQQSTFWTRALWKDVGPLREDLHYAMDLALWFSMLGYRQPVIVDKVLACFRIHHSAKGTAAPFQTRQEVLDIFKAVLRTLSIKERYVRAQQAAENAIWWAHDSYQAAHYEEARYYLRAALHMKPALAFSRKALPLVVRLALGTKVIRFAKNFKP